MSGLVALFQRPRQRQVAALVWRRQAGEPASGAIEILTITTRRTGRWSIPRGWSIKGMTSAEAAAQEAWEEAGIRGEIAEHPLGEYTYEKSRSASGPAMRMVASVYALHASEMLDDYPESGQRKRVWRAPDAAADVVREPELKSLLRGFAP